jgi:hypothetical protein
MLHPLARLVSPLALVLGCVAGPTAQGPVLRPSITIVSARCAGASSCVLGHVSTSLDAGPIAKAAVFVQREGEALSAIQTLTDEQGVFTLIDPPPGRYRIVVIKDGAKVEAVGLELGRPGTTLIPIRLALE